MKKLLTATAALVVMDASPAMAASCCGKKGICCCDGMDMKMSKRRS